MPLDEYRHKRDFARTSEPSGGPSGGEGGDAADESSSPSDGHVVGGGLLYVIHEHAARSHHYDLRLEWNGVLMSWAVPKGPSFDPADKRLAVHVEDHPLEYGAFEGTIPPGEYGAGTVIVWDRGSWEPITDPDAGLAKGDFKFTLHGVKLQGAWVLVRLKPRPGEKRDNWLLIKERDGEARPRAEYDVLVERTGSVTSAGASATTGAADPPQASDPPQAAEAQRAAEAPRAIAVAALPGATPASLPDRISPALATLSEATPEGDGWLHEVKLDGYRVLARIEDGRVRMLTRGGHDWTDRFVPLGAALETLPALTALLDGEVVVLDASGVSGFSALQEALSSGDGSRLRYHAFDLPYVNGYDLRAVPLMERKAALRALLAGVEGPVTFVDHVLGRGAGFRDEACRFDLEGVVSKRADSPYSEGRSRSWLKSKCGRRQEFVVGGFTAPESTRTGVGALLVGYHDAEGALRFAGRVGSGFSERVLKALAEALPHAAVTEPPFVDPPTRATAKGVTWVRPVIVAEVSFAGWTREGLLRQPVFGGLREDVDPAAVVLERPISGASDARPPDPKSVGAPAPAPETVAGVRLTHPERLLFPDSALTKAGLAAHYETVAERMLPHVVDRPLTLLRCPHGTEQYCFYQRHIAEGLPPHVRAVPIDGMTDPSGFLVVDGIEGIVELVQLGTLEFHVWGSRASEPELPDRLVLDLDPDESVDFAQVIEASLALRDRLEGLGLRCFPMTTGGKGLHVVAPIVPERGWREVEDFARNVVTSLVRAHPERFTANMRKNRRVGLIYLDYVRNTKSGSAVAPYSTRARARAPVAVPLAWDEVRPGLEPATFTADAVRQRVTRAADPWAAWENARTAMTDAMISAAQSG